MTDRSVQPAPDAGQDPPDVPLDTAAISRLRLVIARLYRQLAQASSRQDLPFAQLSALARVEEHGPLRLGRLAAHERVAAPSMTRTITPLAERGLIRREPDPQDGRSFLVSITPAGRDVLAELRRERSQMLARRIARLGPEQCAALAAAVPVLEQLLAEPEPERQGQQQGSEPQGEPGEPETEL